MTPNRLLGLSLATLLLAACTKPQPAAPTPGSAPGPEPAASAAAAATTPAEPAAPETPPQETQRVAYRCGDGSSLVLRLFDDARARIDVEGQEQVLRPVQTEDGTLFLGDEVNLRITGQEATLSRAGIVLKTGCKYQPA